jgi:hypothetical protein
MLGQIGAACLHITRGCEDFQKEVDSAEVLPALQELEHALAELYTNARKLRQNAMSIELGECQEDAASCDCSWHENLKRAEESHIDPALDHDGKTEPANEVPADPVCKCGHKKTEHMAEGPFLHALCVRCECDGFEK